MTAILPSDVQWFLSNPSASTGYSGSGTAGNSLGKYMSTTQINQSVLLDNLFLDITGPENAAMQVDYQCLFMMNMTATSWSMQNVAIWIPTIDVTPGGCTMQLGLDPTGVVQYNQSAQQAVLIGSSTTAPAGVSWYPPSTLAGEGLLPGNIAPFHGVAVWFQRTAINGSAITDDSFSVQAQFQSNA
jgi:hypothetical protein